MINVARQTYEKELMNILPCWKLAEYFLTVFCCCSNARNVAVFFLKISLTPIFSLHKRRRVILKIRQVVLVKTATKFARLRENI